MSISVLDQFLRYVAGPSLLCIVFASFILVRIFLCIKYDKQFKHVRMRGYYYGPPLLRAFARSSLYALMIVCGDEWSLKKKKALSKLFNGYPFRKYASRFEIVLSFTLYISFAASCVLSGIFIVLK